MSTKSSDTLKKLDEQIAQLQNRKRALEYKEKQKIRKEHIRLLIKYGEIAEKYTECKSPEELIEYLEFYKKLGLKPSNAIPEISPDI